MNSMSYKLTWDSDKDYFKTPERVDLRVYPPGPYPVSSFLFDTEEEAWAYFDTWFEQKIKKLEDAHQNGLNQRSTNTDQ